MMSIFKSKSVRNELAIIKVKSADSSVETVTENDVDQKHLDFCYAITPLYTCSRLVGLMPFTIIRSPSGNGLAVKVTGRDLVWFITAILWYTVLALISTKNLRLPQDPNESLTINVGDHMIIISGLLMGSFSIVLDMFNRNRLINMAQKYEIFDKKVSAGIINFLNKIPIKIHWNFHPFT